MITYCHSGAFGDIIYSLPVIKHFGSGDLYIKLNSMNYVTARFSYAQIHVMDFHKGKMSKEDFAFLAPLLEAQSYIGKIRSTVDPALEVTYDLDLFRKVLFRTFAGNYLAGYFRTFDIPYTTEDLVRPWLSVTPKCVASTVFARTFRYRNPRSEEVWRSVLSNKNALPKSIFVGLPEEHADFESYFGITVPYYKCATLLEMAEVIAGSNQLFGNQSVAYAIAQGLGKNTCLETIPDRSLQENECFFDRSGCAYF